MEYLSQNDYVHRDLAARNCLLDENMHVKIADFGLTKQIFDKNYYRGETDGYLPFAWMGVELLTPNKKRFTTKSDVWSYGVLLWELLSRGERPYYNIIRDMFSLSFYLKSGSRLERPKHCPNTVYEF